MSALYLHTRNPQWWQFITAAFCHYSWDHLSSNLFMLYTFGKIVEEEEGAAAVWLTYIVCALGDWSPCTRLPSVQHLSPVKQRAHQMSSGSRRRVSKPAGNYFSCMQQAQLSSHAQGCNTVQCYCRCQCGILPL